jgi:hypothetical protein
LSNKSTYLAYKITYRKISEINVKAKFLRLSFLWKILLWKTPNVICIEKEFWSKSRLCWEMKNGSRKTLDYLRLWRSFRFFFGMKFNFSVACEFSQPLLFTLQKSTSMEVMPIFSHCVLISKIILVMLYRNSKEFFSAICLHEKYSN